MQNFKRCISALVLPSDNPGQRRYTGVAPSKQDAFCHHCILALCNSGDSENPIVLDLTKMQYGSAARGSRGEVYFLGRLGDYKQEMEGLCGTVEAYRRSFEEIDIEHEKSRLRNSIRTTVQHYRLRGMLGWCVYCGRLERFQDLLRCEVCKSEVEGWCCEAHRSFGQTLHDRKCKGPRGDDV